MAVCFRFGRRWRMDPFALVTAAAPAAPALLLLELCCIIKFQLHVLRRAEDVQGDLLTLLTFYSNENDYCQGSSEPRVRAKSHALAQMRSKVYIWYSAIKKLLVSLKKVMNRILKQVLGLTINPI